MSCYSTFGESNQGLSCQNVKMIKSQLIPITLIFKMYQCGLLKQLSFSLVYFLSETRIMSLVLGQMRVGVANCEWPFTQKVTHVLSSYSLVRSVCGVMLNFKGYACHLSKCLKVEGQNPFVTRLISYTHGNFLHGMVYSVQGWVVRTINIV